MIVAVGACLIIVVSIAIAASVAITSSTATAIPASVYFAVSSPSRGITVYGVQAHNGHIRWHTVLASGEQVGSLV